MFKINVSNGPLIHDWSGIFENVLSPMFAFSPTDKLLFECERLEKIKIWGKVSFHKFHFITGLYQ